MKALEYKIQEILSEHYDTDIIACYSPNDTAEQFPRDIAKEVKEISIAFAEFKKDYPPVANGMKNLYQHPQIRRVLTIDEIFHEFIKKRYK